MSIQKIIQESINGNPLEMKEALAEELRARVALALEAKMKDEEEDDDSEEDNDDEDDMKKESFDLSDYTVEELEDFMKSEDFNQLDELSKKTLGSYIKKASDSAASKGMEYGAKKAQSDEMDRMMNRHMSYSDKDKVRSIMKTTSSDVNAPREKAARRLQGIDRAADRLTK